MAEEGIAAGECIPAARLDSRDSAREPDEDFGFAIGHTLDVVGDSC